MSSLQTYLRLMRSSWDIWVPLRQKAVTEHSSGLVNVLVKLLHNHVMQLLQEAVIGWKELCSLFFPALQLEMSRYPFEKVIIFTFIRAEVLLL